MSERDSGEQRRLRRNATTRYAVVPEAEASAEQPVEKTDADDSAAAQRMDQQTLWVDLQVRKAMERGEFDNLPGAGKPLHLPEVHDPDWWVKRLIEREKLTGVAPPAIGLRQEDADLNATIDREWSQDGVRRVVDDFNRRVIEARRQLTGGPPVVTKLRDADEEVRGWRERREAARRRGQQAARDTRGPRRRAEAAADGAARPSLVRRLGRRRSR